MSTYSISYDTEYGEAYYEGFEGQHYQSFIRSATNEGIAYGLIEQGDSVLSHDYELNKD